VDESSTSPIQAFYSR